MKTIFRLLIIAIIALIVYNYFYGDETEKETSAQVVDHARQLGQSLWEMIRVEKDRFSDGKHQEIVDNIGSTIGFIRDNREAMNISDSQLMELEKHQNELDSLILNHSEEIHDEIHISDEAKEKLRLLLDRVEGLIDRD
ncbi:MAG: hypothetical protein EA362_06345 [Saprospirales bacterium]|nr:MAG: hypothetical protein EA362_06345 [Saprospirales bacterium]